MSNIILSTGLVVTDDSLRQVDVSVFVSDTDWVGRYDKLQVFRSTLGPAGPFEEITGEAWQRPRLPSDAGDEPTSPVTGGLVELVGKDLEVAINDDELTITFTGSDPLTLAQAAAQIESQGLGRLNSYVDATGQLVIESSQPGLASRIKVLPSDGQVALELPASSAVGRDPRPSLVSGQNLYTLRDYFSSKFNYYRVRLLDSVTGSQSEPSVSSSAKNITGVSVSNIIIGYVDLTQQSGSAYEGAEVHLYNDGVGPLVEGKLITGQATVKYTDEAGHAEFPVVRGQRLTISVQGTNHIRTVTSPVDPTVKKFNFFDPGIADDDVFKVAVPDLIVAERRTL